MKNVIAFSLWGNGDMYWVDALRNIELAKKYFPTWICRFYIDDKCYKPLIETIKGDNVEVVLVNSKDSFEGMFWRFYAACDPTVDIFLSRDCDSRISDREVACINEWLASNKDFHIMRDHPYHTVPILGGMWGCRNGILKDIDKDIEKWSAFSKKGCDQDFLGQITYPKIINNAIEHIDFGLNFGGNIRPFPTKRINYEYVGDIFNEYDERHPDYWQLIKQTEI
jgi:hypothetical protein